LDPTYTEQSWITQHSTKGPIRLLPRLREKIAQHYPGTRIALTEYYYGGGADISGALAQADVLGIFGREGVFAAALWHLGKSDHHMIYAAFDMYRNYDGQGGAFGPIGLAAQSSDPARASIYASQNQQGQVVLVAINKVTEDLTVRINLRHCPAAAKAQVYRLTAADVKPLAIGRIDVARFGQIETRLPAYSVSTLVVGAAGKP
jgi:O-glycosyl hydrolase